MNENLQEYTDSRGLSIGADRQRGVIRGVKILGIHSRNGRTYLAEAVEHAVPLYEGAKVNVNHARGAAASPRDYQDRIGVIRNVAVRADEGLFGDFHFNPKHALAEQLLWDAEHAPENVGFSHNVMARTGRRGDTVVVEAITKVQSVDLVADPATTQGLFEASGAASPADPGAAQETVLLESLTLERLREARPDLLQQSLADSRERLETLSRENEELRAAEQARGRREAVLRLLAEQERSGVMTPAQWQRSMRDDAFLAALVETDDDEERRRLIRERIEMVRDLVSPHGNSQPVSRGPSPFSSTTPDDVKSFVRSIC